MSLMWNVRELWEPPTWLSFQYPRIQISEEVQIFCTVQFILSGWRPISVSLLIS